MSNTQTKPFNSDLSQITSFRVWAPLGAEHPAEIARFETYSECEAFETAYNRNRHFMDGTFLTHPEQD